MPATHRFHVLIATDGSSSARAAMTTAVRFPWPAGTRGSAVVAKEVRRDYRHSILLAALDRTSEITARSASRALRRRWPDGGVRVIDASPVDAILTEARKVRADIIVMGWRGHGPVRRLLAGTVSRRVARGAHCAVLVVRRPIRVLRRVVIGVDGSDNAERALTFLAALEPSHGARITVFTAVDILHTPAQGLAAAATRATVAAEVKRINEGRRAAARTNLSQAAKTLSSAGWKVDQVITDGAPLRDLLATVSNVGADLLVVGARGVTGLRHLLLGSVAEGALSRSPVPVLVVR
jgi:nucleotide-binding universal stress UspA family protein